MQLGVCAWSKRIPKAGRSLASCWGKRGLVLLLLTLASLLSLASLSFALTPAEDAAKQKEFLGQLNRFDQDKDKDFSAPNPLEPSFSPTEKPTLADLENKSAARYPSDIRQERPWKIQIVSKHLILWGLEAGYHFGPYVYLGGSFMTADLMTPLFGAMQKIELKARVDALSRTESTSFYARFNNRYNEKRLVLRIFPFLSRSLYLETALYQQAWPGDVLLNSKLASAFQTVKIHYSFPKTAQDFAVGWDWVNSGGFGVRLGLLYSPKTSFETSFRQASAALLTDKDRKQIAQAIADRAPFLERRFSLQFGFGTNF